jgi:subtilisin family serine protease
MACPDSRCLPAIPNAPTITGANSHPEVICVAGVDINGTLVGYSSLGPGALANEKPDIAAFTHFLGSEAFGKGMPDAGTSAACPVMAGVIAALRSLYPWDPQNFKRTPANVKQFLLQNTRNPRAGWLNDVGHGIVNTSALAAARPTLM